MTYTTETVQRISYMHNAAVIGCSQATLARSRDLACTSIMETACPQKVDSAVNFATQSENRVRVSIRVRCSVYYKTLCKMQHIYYVHNAVYIISIMI